MVARLLSLGVMLGSLAAAVLVLVPSSPIHAGGLGVSTPALQPTALFRAAPHEAQHGMLGSRSSGRSVASLRSADGARRSAGLGRSGRGQLPGLLFDGRAGARKAVPVTRGQELGLRFRPDERESPYGQAVVPPGGTGLEPYSPGSESQFRPTQKRRRPTYEELQAETLSPQQPPGAQMPYPLIVPPPMPGYGGGFPPW